MTSFMMEQDNIESFHLALKPDTRLFLSIHTNVSTPQAFFASTRQHSNLAIMNVDRITSPKQVIAAANMAVIRQSQHQTMAWDTVLQASSSSHLGHVLRDNSFGPDSPIQNDATILVLAIGGSLEEYKSALNEVGFNDPQSASRYFEQRVLTSDEIDAFIKWYKLTSEEVAMSSLEQAVLTRISTKYV